MAIIGNDKIGEKTEFELLFELEEYSKVKIPESLYRLEKEEIIHGSIFEIDDMKEAVNTIVSKK